MRITVAFGTRPEFIKLAGVIEGLRRAGHEVRCIATGQHHDPRMADAVLADLGCAPDCTWSLPREEAKRAGALLARSFDELGRNPSDVVLVLGDTYTAPLFAMPARRLGIGVVHLEAGLRSFNERSMEETNRRLMAALATVHLAPTELAASFLRAEGVPDERVRVVGNTVVDAIGRCGVGPTALEERSGILLTAHRATNVDDLDRLEELVAIVGALGNELPPVTFAVHPRTRDRLVASGLLQRLETPGVELTQPLPYRDMLARMSRARLIVTDSGGLQEEASYFGIPIVVLRRSTPRWEGVASGSAVLTGLDRERVLSAARQLLAPSEQARIAALPCPYGDGHAVERVVAAFADADLMRRSRPAEPDFTDESQPLPDCFRTSPSAPLRGS